MPPFSKQNDVIILLLVCAFVVIALQRREECKIFNKKYFAVPKLTFNSVMFSIYLVIILGKYIIYMDR